jgi:hypothetical protein
MDTNRHGVEIFYTLCDLIQFYSLTYQRILPSDNSVHNAVRECLTEGKKSFIGLLDKQSEQLKHATVSLFAMDTLSTNTTKESCQLLKEILKIFKSSMSLSQQSTSPIASPHPSPSPEMTSLAASSGEEDISINHVLECIIHPVLQSCRTCGNTAFGENNSDMSVFMLNNVSLLKVHPPSLLPPSPPSANSSSLPSLPPLVNSAPVIPRLCLL